jgi:tocopherol O-methyltransferase
MILASDMPTADHVRGHYDDLDWVYRDVWGAHVHHGYWRTGKESPEAAVDALVDLVAGQLDLAPGQALCDIGCGYGASANYLAERHGVSVTGFTLSSAQAGVAAGWRPRRGAIDCRQKDWLANGVPVGCFDHAYAIESTEHMVNKPGFFAEAWRTLRPGGRLAVCAWLADPDATPLSVRYLLEPICREGRLPGMGTPEDYRAMAEEAGFTLLSYQDLSVQVRRTWSICARRVAGKLCSDGRYWRLLLDRDMPNRMFILSLPRLIIALRTGAMRYGLFAWERR